MKPILADHHQCHMRFQAIGGDQVAEITYQPELRWGFARPLCWEVLIADRLQTPTLPYDATEPVDRPPVGQQPDEGFVVAARIKLAILSCLENHIQKC